MEGAASNWSAERVRAEFPEFSLDADPPLFTGEMIYPWMFDDYANLRPLKEAAEILAAADDWPALYDPAVLAAEQRARGRHHLLRRHVRRRHLRRADGRNDQGHALLADQ